MDSKKLLSEVKTLKKRNKELEQLLNEQKESHDQLDLLKNITRILPDIASLSLLSNGQFIEVNDRLLKATGLTRDEVIGKTSVELDVWVDTNDRSKLQSEVQKNNFVDAMEAKFRIKDGTILDSLLSAKKIVIDGIEYMLCVFKDITSYKQALKELDESQERFRKLHEASFGGIGIHDKGGIIEANKGLSDITGFDYDELVGMNGLLLIAPEWRDRVMNNILSGYEKPYEVEGLRKDGSRYDLLIQGKQIPYHGQTLRVTEFRDITEQKQREEAQKKLEEQLRQVQKMDSIGTLVGGIAHDFNNLLTVISGHAELSQKYVNDDSPIKDSLVEIDKAVQYAIDLTRKLMAFSRKQIFEPKVIDINKTISGMLKILRRFIGEDIKLETHCANDLCPVLADPSQIEQILMNLVINARDAIDALGQPSPDRRITIETSNVYLGEQYTGTHPGSQRGSNIMLSVSDNGIGMVSDLQDKIFEPFFTTKGRGKGTGLGLSTVYGIVKQNCGYIMVYSEPNHGSTFKIYWPVTGGVDLAEQLEKEKQTDVSGHESILLVEDDSGVCTFACRALESNGYRVVCAANGREALDLVEKKGVSFDLLLTDVIMPEINGPELSERLHKIIPSIKILFTSGYADHYIAHNGILDKNVNFLQKPYSVQSLVEKVREVLNKKESVC